MSAMSATTTCATTGCGRLLTDAPAIPYGDTDPEPCANCGRVFCATCAFFARDDVVGGEGESIDLMMKIRGCPMSSCDACYKIVCNDCATAQGDNDDMMMVVCQMCEQRKHCFTCATGPDGGPSPDEVEATFVPCGACDSPACSWCAAFSHRTCTDAAGESDIICEACFTAAPEGTYTDAKLLGE